MLYYIYLHRRPRDGLLVPKYIQADVCAGILINDSGFVLHYMGIRLIRGHIEMFSLTECLYGRKKNRTYLLYGLCRSRSRRRRITDRPKIARESHRARMVQVNL